MDALPQAETVTCEKRDGMALVSINRPHVLNALNRQTLEHFPSQLARK